MNCLFFTTVFNVFTTDLHLFTTHPSIFTTHPSILTTQFCLLNSEICGDLDLGRHTILKFIIFGDALTVSVPNIYPSTTTVGTNCVCVISTGAASRGACRNVSSSHGRHLPVSLCSSCWAVREGRTQNLSHYNPLALLTVTHGRQQRFRQV
jgi:hypothetical protein